VALINSLFRLDPAPGIRNAPVRFAGCVFLAVGIGGLAGQPLYGIVGSLGALAALYAGGSALQATRVVALAALGLVASVVVGASADGHPWLGVAVVGVWAIVVTVVCELISCPLPGRLMFILVAAVGIALPPGNTGRYALVVLAAGAVAVLLTAVDQWRVRAPAIPAYHWRPRSLRRTAIPRVALRIGIGVALAGAVTLALGLQYPGWSMIAVGANLGQATYATMAASRAVQRMTGVAVGAALSIPLLLLAPHGLVLALILALLSYVLERTVPRNFALAMVFVAPILLLMSGVPTAGWPMYKAVLTLLANTLIGVLCAMVAGQLVTRRWAVSQRYYSITDLLTATEAAIADRSLVGELQHARERSAVVTRSTDSERRAVRKAAAAWDALDAEAGQLAQEVIAGSRPAEELSVELRGLSVAVESKHHG
jgi:hypothetical protein